MILPSSFDHYHYYILWHLKVSSQHFRQRFSWAASYCATQPSCIGTALGCCKQWCLCTCELNLGPMVMLVFDDDDDDDVDEENHGRGTMTLMDIVDLQREVCNCIHRRFFGWGWWGKTLEKQKQNCQKLPAAKMTMTGTFVSHRVHRNIYCGIGWNAYVTRVTGLLHGTETPASKVPAAAE